MKNQAKTKTTATTTATANDLYTTAEKAVYIALRARHEKSGLQFLAELQNAQAQDRTARNCTEYARQIADIEKLHDEHTETAKHYNTRAKLLKLTADERAHAKTLADHYATLAKQEQATLADLYEQISTTYTDRADLTQTAVLQILENAQNPAPITASICASYGAETADELTDTEREEAQARANFKAVVNSVGRAIGTLATPDALNRTTTIKTQATADAVNQWAKQYGGTGADIKIPVSARRCRSSDCFDTMEYIETKTAQGWYKIRHYKTVAPYQYIGDYTDEENGETDGAYLKTYNPFISNRADLDRIEELCERADLTDRQRAFLEHFARACRFDCDFKKCKAHAFRAVGLTTTTAQTSFFHRLKKALATATE